MFVRTARQQPRNDHETRVAPTPRAPSALHVHSYPPLTSLTYTSIRPPRRTRLFHATTLHRPPYAPLPAVTAPESQSIQPYIEHCGTQPLYRRTQHPAATYLYIHIDHGRLYNRHCRCQSTTFPPSPGHPQIYSPGQFPPFSPVMTYPPPVVKEIICKLACTKPYS